MNVSGNDNRLNPLLDRFLLTLLVVCLGFRDILPNLKISPLFFLAFIFLIPCMLIVKEILHKQTPCFLLGRMILIVGFYVAIIPLNLNGVKLFLPLFLSAIAFRNMNYKFVVRAFFLLEVIVLLVRIILIQEGFLDVSYMYTDKTERGISYDLGYGNPNTPGITIFVMLCCLYILTYERFRWLSFIGIALISVITFDYTASRTTFYCEILLLLTYFVPRGFLKRYIYNKILLGLIPILLVAFIFMGEYLSDFNTLTSGRISNMYILMGMFSSPLTFLTGLQSDMVGDVDFPIDNGIAYMLCVGGIIAVGLFLIRYYSWVKEKDMIPTVLLSVIIVMLISGVGEKTIANFGVSGGSLFWMLLFNNSYRKMIVKM